MIKHSILVTHPFGLHSRICSGILRVAKDHRCQLAIEFKGTTHRNDSILMLMQSGIVKGSRFDVTVDGEGDTEAEKACSQALKTYIEQNLGDLVGELVGDII